MGSLQYAGQGSPPHTRGKAYSDSLSRKHNRITPAHAGKRGVVQLRALPCRDHPRTRGEKQSLPSPASLIVGSPPHTRGKVRLDRYYARADGITPAHAGKSHRRHSRRCESRDHPRTRGEKRLPGFAAPAYSGSPPHTRGKGQTTRLHQATIGITPAHAGKSVPAAFWAAR